MPTPQMPNRVHLKSMPSHQTQGNQNRNLGRHRTQTQIPQLLQMLLPQMPTPQMPNRVHLKSMP
ncbi:hypothetical protein HGM15179_018943, partial [Zosterops borbonicus]